MQAPSRFRSDPPCELRLFGGFALLGPDGEPTDAVQPQSKGAALLAFLASREADAPVSRERLLPLIWPDRSEDRARNALRVLLSRLRADLPDGAVGGKGEDRLWLDASVMAVDVRAFRRALDEERFRDALELYRGPFLEHVRVSDADRFERWAEEKRSALHRQALEAARSLGDRAEERGELAAAEEAYERALDLAPMEEEVAARLVRVLAKRGAHARALQRHEEFAKRLRHELDLSPSPQYRELADRIREEREEGEASAAAVGSDAEADAVSAPTSDGASAAGRDAAGPAGRPVLLAAAVAVALAAGLGLWLGDGPAGSEAGRDAGERIEATLRAPVVAVLPFDRPGRSSGDGADPLVRGLHAGLVTRLANVSGLSVIGRESTRRYAGREGRLAAVADSLGARWILTGDVSESGDRVRVRVRLVDAESGERVWGRSYRRGGTAGDLFDIQAEITRDIARSLEAEISGEEAGRVAVRPTDDLEAYRLYQEGRGLLRQRTDSTLRQALDRFRRAAARDSTFAGAWAGVADARSFLFGYGDADPDTLLGPAVAAARRSLELDPDLAEGRTALGRLHFYRGDAPGALRELGRAVDRTQSYAAAYETLGMVQLTIGRREEALESIRQAVALDPLAPENRYALSWAHMALGNYEAALSAARRAREIQPDYGSTFLENMAQLHLGREPSAEWGRRLGSALRGVAAGDSAEARELAEEWEAGGRLFTAGVLHASLGHHGEAVELFEDRFRRSPLRAGGATIPIRYFFPERLAGLRADSRYRELLREINRAWGLAPDGSLPGSPGSGLSPSSEGTGSRPGWSSR